ncbi:hypothetical protein HanXRQr2_Chr03g0101531 [Helianthus annuus]|uniref:Uncharacterized protein n=1 Tax=Helianthus annuus TaxID=4232 RepID=A0A9K3JDW9_HELAN|nr:hypothetical protein HanXRQr2_Chr03g0101531 [Helianthus annuus]KAJ0942915.1 hypothetical protein HanPSC8_Chr03g0097841 [Helianthus annuus]
MDRCLLTLLQEEAHAHSPVPDLCESVASASLRTRGVQHHSHDADPDMASSAAPVPAHSFEFDHDIENDPVFPPGFDPDHDMEFIHLDQPLEDSVVPIDPMFDDPADFEIEFVDPEPAVAPEPGVAPDPALEHDSDHADAPSVAP